MTQTCRQNPEHAFDITEADLAFYAKMDVPPPTLCPTCRVQRRMGWRNERVLYDRKCGSCGSELISIYAQGNGSRVYCQKCWWDGDWSGEDFGRDFDFSRPFFDQFAELLRLVPYPNLNLQAGNENCEYTNLTSYNRNGYLIFAASNNQDCYYSAYLQRSRDCVDCFFTFDSELCYQCVDCYGGYNLSHCQYVSGCRDSSLLYDCKACSDCFGCVGLANKRYHLFNQPHSKEEYETKVGKILADPAYLGKAREIFDSLKMRHPQRYSAGMNNENVTGDHLSFSKDCADCYDCTYLEDCKYCTWLHRSKDCYDCYAFGMPGERGYENHLCGNGFYDVRFSASCFNDVSALTYCYFCVNGSSTCFGCVGLRKGQYSILNKRYPKEEYEALVPRIIEHMKRTGEWGEFFPLALSPFGYNETAAQDYMPLDADGARALGARWHEVPKTSAYHGPTVPIPSRIEDTDDTILKAILSCTGCGKNYKIIAQELRFYRRTGVSVPQSCFNCRHLARMAQRNPRVLHDRACMKCSAPIRTTYAPDRKETVYCEKCYQEAVY